jgi:CheY-like chemotaxis protein
VESQLGQGSRFSFTLPMGAQESAGELTERVGAANARSGRDSAFRDPLILVVDDENPARELVASYLEPEGYRVEVATTPAEALKKAKQLQPNAITLDILMPNASGFEVLLSLKKETETADIPIIVVSIVDQQKVGFALGAADYLVKPVSKQAVLNAICKYTKPQSAGDTSILIVDDDCLTLHLLDTMLRSAGYKVHAAGSGKAALAFLSSNQVDAILLDLLMPEMDGFEVLSKLKKDCRLEDIPVLILTAKSLTESDLAQLHQLTQALFQKAGSWREELIATLTNLVENRRKEHLTGIA